MIRVEVEVRDGALLHRLVVQSRSVQGALSFVEEHYVGDGEARIVFPIEAEAFFVKDPDAVVGLVHVEKVCELPASSEQGSSGSHLDGRESLLADVVAASRTGRRMVAISEHAAQSVEDERKTVESTISGVYKTNSSTNTRRKGGLHT